VSVRVCGVRVCIGERAGGRVRVEMKKDLSKCRRLWRKRSLRHGLGVLLPSTPGLVRIRVPVHPHTHSQTQKRMCICIHTRGHALVSISIQNKLNIKPYVCAPCAPDRQSSFAEVVVNN
jgi:hypothetical protein